MNGPSAHLSWDELACRDPFQTPYPLDWRKDRLPVLAALFEAIRQHTGPLIVDSAYRTPAWNFKQGGAPDSQHVQGRALDIRSASLSADDLWHLIQTMIPYLPTLRGLGRYASWVHVDTRPSLTLIQWDLRTSKDNA